MNRGYILGISDENSLVKRNSCEKGKQMNQDLFFVNDIFSTYSKAKDNENIMINLFKVKDSQHSDDVPSESKLFKISNQMLLDLNIREGNFVYINEQKKEVSESANKDKRSKRELYKNNMIRGKLIQKYTSIDEKNNSEKVEQVHSYHVNVGHGNCSIIVVLIESEYKIWIVDCSEYDFRNHTNYRRNITECLEFIKVKFNLDRIKIDKLFITHPHYDHISGIRYLIRQNYLESTEVWVNLYYSWPDSHYSQLLYDLESLNLTLIEPNVSNSTSQIEILYPNNTVLRTNPQNNSLYPQYTIVPTNKINNSSVVYKLNLGDKSMVFPGDLEEDGWNEVINCNPFLRNATFYCISHHGSITGHKRTRCNGIPNISNIAPCCLDKDINILMGRNGAFPGIFNQQVLDCFRDRVYRTDIDITGNIPTFLELNWQDNRIMYYSNGQALSEVAATILL